MATITFKTRLYTVNDWTILRVSRENSDKLPSRGQVMAKGTVNDLPFHDALEPDGNWGHWLHVTDEMKQAVGLEDGAEVEVTLEATKDWPEPQIPADWQATLDGDAGIMALWQRVTPMARWEWLRWINSTENPETRQRRIEVSCDKLRKGMRRPCCFNRSMCCVPQVSKSGVLLDSPTA